jgi:hypothetical protein
MREKQDDYNIFFGPEFGVKEGKLRLPKGVVTGVQLEAVLRGLSKVQGFHNFDDLPIPFRAVATDPVTGKAVVFSEGELASVMRASMSVPGRLFAGIRESRRTPDRGQSGWRTLVCQPLRRRRYAHRAHVPGLWPRGCRVGKLLFLSRKTVLIGPAVRNVIAGVDLGPMYTAYRH